MQFKPFEEVDSSGIVNLFARTFADSEGESEGALIGRLVCDLTQPEGWLCQSLDGSQVGPLAGRARCVEAFDDPGYW